MRLDILKKDIKVAHRLILGLAGVCGVLILVILLMGFAINRLAHRESVFLVPMTLNSPEMVSSFSVSSQYLVSMGESVVGLRLNFTPQTAKADHALLESYFAPSVYAHYQALMDREVQLIQKQGISSNFMITSVQADQNTLSVKITGMLSRWVDTSPLPPVSTTFLVAFKNQNGLLQILKFEELKDGSNQ